MSPQESKCPVNATKIKLESFYFSDDPKTMMCSKCHPCKLGIYDAVKIIEAIQAGRGEERLVGLLRRIAEDVKEGSLCKKGKDHADVLAALLTAHGEDLERHVKGVCTSRECAYLVRYEITPELCIMCDKCREVCKDFAIEGQKQVSYKTGYAPYRIRQKRCTHCGECLKVCPVGAVHVVEEIAVEAGK